MLLLKNFPRFLGKKKLNTSGTLGQRRREGLFQRRLRTKICGLKLGQNLCVCTIPGTELNLCFN